MRGDTTRTQCPQAKLALALQNDPIDLYKVIIGILFKDLKRWIQISCKEPAKHDEIGKTFANLVRNLMMTDISAASCWSATLET